MREFRRAQTVGKKKRLRKAQRVSLQRARAAERLVREVQEATSAEERRYRALMGIASYMAAFNLRFKELSALLRGEKRGER